MFEIGDKVICIDDIINNYLIVDVVKDGLKTGKMYVVTDNDYDSKNDKNYISVDGINCFFLSHRFIKLSEYRKQKIKNLKSV